MRWRYALAIGSDIVVPADAGHQVTNGAAGAGFADGEGITLGLVAAGQQSRRAGQDDDLRQISRHSNYSYLPFTYFAVTQNYAKSCDNTKVPGKNYTY